MHLSFLLPRDNRSGGVRVTAIMAEFLRDKGYHVRIICLEKPSFSVRFKEALKNNFSSKNKGWLHIFKGPVLWPKSPAELNFEQDEVVIGVGTYTLGYLIDLPHDVIKLRFNHGMPAQFDDEAKRVWKYSLPSITVSNTLVPILEGLSPGSVLGVVPNGIDRKQYYNMNQPRDGVGVFYSRHPNKAPEFIIEVIQNLKQRYPDVPLRVISTTQCPDELQPIVEFHRLPSVDQVREIYNSCKVWLLPSDTEGLPGPVLESLSCGTVVVSTNNDGSLEIIEPEKNGLISPRRDLEAFIHNVGRVLTDESLRQTLSKAGEQRADEFSWDAAVEKMEKVLETLIDNHRQQAGSKATAAAKLM